MTHPRALAGVLAAGVLLTAAGNAAAAQKVQFLQGEQVVGVDRPGATVRTAVADLLRGPTAAERARGIRTQIPPRVPILGIAVVNGVATVDLGARFAVYASAERLNARLSQLVLTVDAVPGVRSVRVRIDGGTPYGLFPGVDLTRPVTTAGIRAPDLPPPVNPGPGTGPAVPDVADLERRLADLGYLDAAKADGISDAATTNAVIAFQKWQRLGRDGVAGPQTLGALQTAVRPAPRATGDAKRVEVLLDRQLALYIENGQVARTLHISTGQSGFATPTGTYRITRRYTRDWSVPYSVWLPWAQYFVGGVAFHEAASVPVTPASHGCVRLPNGDAQWLYDRTPVGTQVIVLGASS